MTNLLIDSSNHIENLVEGSSDKDENPEPKHRLKTSTQLVAAKEFSMPAAETGVLPKVELSAEGKEISDTQDASRTTDEIKTETIPQPKTQPVTEKSPTILIVEDTTELAEVIQATLERINMVTMHETHGARALTLLNETNPDLVLLDISLPDMTGWKILDAIKEKHEKTNTQMPIVIVITAYGDPANRLVGKLQGIYTYLIKPFTADEVEKTVMEALSGAAL